MNKLLEELVDEFGVFQDDAEKAANGNKSAGVRARKSSLKIAKLMKDWRSESLGKK